MPVFQKIYLWFLSLLFQKDHIFLQNVFSLYHFFIFTGKIPRQNLHWTLNWSLNNEGRKCKEGNVEGSFLVGRGGQIKRAKCVKYGWCIFLHMYEYGKLKAVEATLRRGRESIMVRVNRTRVHCAHVQKCHNDTPCTTIVN
jgi:hypothetical protein